MRLGGNSPEIEVLVGSPLVYPVVIVANFIAAWALGVPRSSRMSSLWLAFTVARMLVRDLFDTRSLKITALSALNEFLIITALPLAAVGRLTQGKGGAGFCGT